MIAFKQTPSPLELRYAKCRYWSETTSWLLMIPDRSPDVTNHLKNIIAGSTYSYVERDSHFLSLCNALRALQLDLLFIYAGLH